jgi:hypothetical protein
MNWPVFDKKVWDDARARRARRNTTATTASWAQISTRRP